jgi:BMFP domain-containing protein YqiC
MEQNRFEDLAKRLLESIPPSLRAAQKDLEANFRSALRTGLSRLDMVTRDEFDAQSRVLERSRELIEALEKRVAQLEAGQRPTAAGSAEPPLPQD